MEHSHRVLITMSQCPRTPTFERTATRTFHLCPPHLHPHHARAIGVLSQRIPPRPHNVMGSCHHASKYLDLHLAQAVPERPREALGPLPSLTELNQRHSVR